MMSRNKLAFAGAVVLLATAVAFQWLRSQASSTSARALINTGQTKLSSMANQASPNGLSGAGFERRNSLSATPQEKSLATLRKALLQQLM